MTFHEYLSKAVQNDAQLAAQRHRLILVAQRAREDRPTRASSAASVRRLAGRAGALAWLASVLPASAVAAPAALASPLRPDPPWWLTHRALPLHLPPEPPGFFKHPPLPHKAHVHVGPADGMPGWQITLITVGAAILAAAAILLAPALAARRHLTTANGRLTEARDRWHPAHPTAAGPAPTRRPD